VIAIIHILYVVKLGNGNANVQLIANCYGTIFMAFATAISSLTFAPLQCNDHPNGKQTMKDYLTVTCWDSSDHGAMLAIGIIAMLILFSCVATCVYIVSKFPVKMRQGDTNFLQGTRFLFSRFRIGSHYYSLICLFRGMLVALVPVLPGALIQSALLLILLLYSTLTMFVLPWRLLQATFLDVLVTCALIMVLALALFFADKPPLELVSKFCLGIVAIALIVVFIAMSYGFIKKYLFKKKPFQYFLCHHKGGCGSFARLMKMQLNENAKVSEDVFLDSDDLQDLNRLFDVVREDLSTLVVLCTKEILMRPWCAGEITTARMNNIPVVLVVFPDFTFPDDEIINNYGTIVPGCASLAPHGINEDDVQESLRWVKTNPTITFASDVSMGAVEDLVKVVVTNAATKGSNVSIDVKRQLGAGPNKVVILADLAYSEASSTAYVLEKLLLPHMHHQSDLMPRVLPETEDLPSTVSHVILICSRGCFRNANVVRMLLQASNLGACVIPVVSEEAFRFPTEPFFADMRNGGQELMKAAGSDQDIETLIGIIKVIFSEIAVVLHAWNDSHVDLNVRAEVVAKKLLAGAGVALTSVGAIVPEIPAKDSTQAAQPGDLGTMERQAEGNGNNDDLDMMEDVSI